MEVKKVNIIVDGKPFEVLPDRNLLHVCLALGFDIPHFCYHPALGSVGACRLCAVRKYRDANDLKGRIVMSCMEPVVEGLRISVEDEDIKNFRKAVIESLMINHPHDCPVCDEGGECHLQDMTMMTGHNYRRFRFKKRTFTNQYLGPFITHEMNRCIQCYRCIRFYRDYAGGNDLSVFGSHDRLYFGRATDGALESEFSGNLVEVCPTGVFTDKTLGRHYARKWDMTNAPSVCVNCSLGCNTIISQRYDRATRILSRYNGSVNGHFLCDRGRFGYEFINSGNRIRQILVRNSKNELHQSLNEEKVKETVKRIFHNAKNIIGIGSPRASLESNFALSQLVGKENFYSGISEKDKSLIRSAISYLSDSRVHSPSLKEIEKADAILILGEMVTHTAPMMALALRQASRNLSFRMAEEDEIPLWQDDAVRVKGHGVNSPMFIISPVGDKLDDTAWRAFRAAPQDIARIGFGIAALAGGGSPDLNSEESELAENVVNELKKARNPLIISGVHLRDESIVDAAAAVAFSLSRPEKKTFLCYTFTECNSVGTELIESKSLDEAYQRVEKGEADTAIILENNLYIRADRNETENFLLHCSQVIILDHLTSETASKADMIIPAGTFAESTGTVVNNEGRAQRFYCSIPANHPVSDSWKWLGLMKHIKDNQETGETLFEHISGELLNSNPFFRELSHLSDEKGSVLLNEKIARQTPRFSGRTAIRTNISVDNERPADDPDSQLAFSMEGRREFPPSAYVPYYWFPGWNSVQAIYKYLDEPNGSLKGGDPGIRLFSSNGRRKDLRTKNIAPFVSDPNNFLVIPVYHIYGSEELSLASTAVAERISESYIFLNERDADRIGVKAGDLINLTISNYQYILNVKIESISQGMIGLFRRLDKIPYLDLPQMGRITKII